MSSAPRLTSSPAWRLDLDDPSAVTPPAPAIDARCLGVADLMPPERALHLATAAGLTHVVQKQGHLFDLEIAAAERLIEAPDVFREFPISSILTPGQAGPAFERAPILRELPFSSSAHKGAVMGEITKALEDRHAQTLLEDVLAVADELFTNAIYNAPFVDFGSGLNPGVSRQDQTEIRYGAGREARMILAADQSRLLIGCEDPFGTLNLPRYLHRIKETYVRGPAATMNFGPGGAGLGSYIIFNAGSSLYFGVWPGVATILFCVIPLGMSYRKRAQLPKHLHWMQR